jgi:hypothetical protein
VERVKCGGVTSNAVAVNGNRVMGRGSAVLVVEEVKIFELLSDVGNNFGR